MKGLKELLTKEQKRLSDIVEITKTRLKEAPEGRLRISKSHGYHQYYQGQNYITKNNEELIQRLAQKTYDEKVLRAAEKTLAQIKKLADSYDEDEISKIYFEEHELRRKLIIPVEQTWQQRLTDWRSKEYKGKEFGDTDPVILTERGERVRSKSEKIMADYFFRHEIEYKYECPIYLKGMGMVYPDFTFLSRKTGEEIYWEHAGKMDEPVYARKAIRKIQAYENNNIFTGERLILTYETERTILNTGKIEQLVKRYLM